MSEAAAPSGYISRAEFRRWIEQQPRGRFERIEGRIVAMAPERGAHLRVKAAVWLALRNALLEAGIADCQALPDGATVVTDENTDYEPDAVVNCGEPMPDDAIEAPNPVLVVEILSPTTRHVDTGDKLAHYMRLPSLRHYLIVHPTQKRVIHHSRQPGAQDGSDIRTRILTSGELHLDPPGIVLQVESFYAA